MLEHICSPISMSSVSFFSSASRLITHPRLNPSNAISESSCRFSEAARQVRLLLVSVASQMCAFLSMRTAACRCHVVSVCCVQ